MKYICDECGKEFKSNKNFDDVIICENCIEKINLIHAGYMDRVLPICKELEKSLEIIDPEIEKIFENVKNIIIEIGTTEASKILFLYLPDEKGITKQALTNFIKGYDNWSYKKIKRIADAFIFLLNQDE